MNWSIATETLINMIKSFNGSSRKLLRCYDLQAELEDRYLYENVNIDELQKEVSYYEDLFQDISNLKSSIRQFEKSQANLNTELVCLKKEIGFLEREVGSFIVAGIRFLRGYYVDYEVAKEILNQYRVDTLPEDFYAGVPGNTLEICELIWMDE